MLIGPYPLSICYFPLSRTNYFFLPSLYGILLQRMPDLYPTQSHNSFFVIVDTITDAPFPPPFAHLPPVPTSPSPGCHHAVVCASGLRMCVLWLISLPSFIKSPHTLPSEICQADSCIRESAAPGIGPSKLFSRCS